MRFSVVTLFPEIFESVFEVGILGRAIRNGQVSVDFVNPRDFARDKHKSVDDTPYGGGPGMVMKVQPLVEAIESVANAESRRILMAPVGDRFEHQAATRLSSEKHIVLICGRYEGVDERVVDIAVDESLSIGDFVMTGGEIGAMAVIDAVTRLIPGVLGDDQSSVDESYASSLLEYPHYTRPQSYRDSEVPDVLLGGHHKEIETWRKDQSVIRTLKHRRDLAKRNVVGDLTEFAKRCYLVLAHHPVYDRNAEIVTTSVTNLDIHDIARAAMTYGLGGYFVATPVGIQRDKINRIVGIWQNDIKQVGSDDRSEALSLVQVVENIEEAEHRIARNHKKQAPRRIVTSAKELPNQIQPEALTLSMSVNPAPVLIVVGTGFGLANSVTEQADGALAPIYGNNEYNHLSVRSATAILLDRIFDRT